MTEQEEQALHRKVDRLETEVHLLGGIAGIMLSLLGQLGWRQVEQAIIHGLTDAAASYHRAAKRIGTGSWLTSASKAPRSL